MIVIGAGAAGLSAAHHLNRLGIRVSDDLYLQYSAFIDGSFRFSYFIG